MGNSVDSGYSYIVCKECNIGCEVRAGFETQFDINYDSVIANECEHYKFDIDVYTSSKNIQIRLNVLCKNCHFKNTYSEKAGSTEPYTLNHSKFCNGCKRNEKINYKFDFFSRNIHDYYGKTEKKKLNPRFEVYICYKVIQEKVFINRKLPLISHWMCVLKSEKKKFYFTHLQASAEGGDAAKNGKIYLEFGDFEEFLNENGMQNAQVAYTYIGMTEKSKVDMENFVNADKKYANTTYNLLLNNCQDWVRHFVNSLGITFHMWVSLDQLVSKSIHFADSYHELKPNNDYLGMIRRINQAVAMN